MKQAPLDAWARELAQGALAESIPRRWAHAQQAAGRAGELEGVLDRAELELLVASAWVHDIGYAPDAVRTGFGPLDSALHLQSLRAPDRLVALTAHIAAIVLEADQRDLSEAYAPFVDEGGTPVRDGFWWCCTTSGTDGSPVTLQQRIEGWRRDHGHDTIILRWIEEATPEIEAAIHRTASRAAAVGVRLSSR